MVSICFLFLTLFGLLTFLTSGRVKKLSFLSHTRLLLSFSGHSQPTKCPRQYGQPTSMLLYVYHLPDNSFSSLPHGSVVNVEILTDNDSNTRQSNAYRNIINPKIIVDTVKIVFGDDSKAFRTANISNTALNLINIKCC